MKNKFLLALLEVVGDPDDGMVTTKTGCSDGFGNTCLTTLAQNNCFILDNESLEKLLVVSELLDFESLKRWLIQVQVLTS